MTFSGRKKTFPGELPEQATYPVPVFEGYASQHRASLLFTGNEPNTIIVGITGAGKIFRAPHGTKLMKSRVINIEEDQ